MVRRRSMVRRFRVSSRSSSKQGDHDAPVRRRAGHGSDPDQRRRQRDDRELDLPGRLDRGLRRALDHHGQHGPGIDGRHVFAGCIRPPLAARRHARRQSGDTVRSHRPGVSPGQPRRLRLRRRDRGQFIRRRGGPDRQRGRLFGGHGPVRRHQRSRGHPGGEHLRRLVRGQAGRDLGRRPAARPPRPESVRLCRLRRGPGWWSRSWPASTPTERPT